MGEIILQWWEEAKNKYNIVLDKSLEIAKSCCRNEDDTATQIVENYLKKDNKLFKYFGAQQKDLRMLVFRDKNNSEEVTYNEWCLHLWGRRIYSFLSIFTRGLYCATECENILDHKVDRKILKVLSKKCKILEDVFKPKPRTFNAMQSLEERGDIANFHITYLDPKLFSALMFWQRMKKQSRENDDNKKRLAIILGIIEREVSRYTRDGQIKIKALADESTLWWGIRVLLEEKKNEFKIGRNKKGYKGALQICLNLIESDKHEIPRYPEKNFVMTEATWEIHGEFRTRLLISMNCVQILQSLPSDLKEEACSNFFPFIEEQILYAVKSPDNIFQHIYFNGVFLEAIKPYLIIGSTVRKKDNSDTEVQDAKPESLRYDNIVDRCYKIGVEMERHKRSYKNRKEEDLRDYFIIALSPHYQSVTGETENKEGKTDILIRNDGKNLFLAECKIWRGKKTFYAAYNQLTKKYTTWRDKIAIIFFVHNKDMTSVLKQIQKAIKSKAVKDSFEELSEGSFKAKFFLNGPKNNKVKIAILCFHFP